jgi:gliding motility-associated-like protein
MKLILTTILFFISLIGYSQQTIEICEIEPEVTYTYWVNTDIPTNLVWNVNGYQYFDEQLTMIWDSVGVYTISVSGNSLNGDCPTNIQIFTVTVVECEELIYYVPNSFTPDGDSYNNTFQPIFTSGYDIYNFRMFIFNRWGEIVWESYDASAGWDGNYGGLRCQDGVYTWRIDFGVLGTDERITDHGHIVLIR